MIANLSKIVLPGVDSTLAIDDSDRHANLCGESILANIPKVYQLPIGPVWINYGASVFNGWLAVAADAGEASQVDSKQKAKVTQKYNAKARFLASFHPLSALAKSMLYCGVAETCPFIFRLGWHVDEKGSAGKFKPFPWAARSPKNPSTPQQSIFKRGARILSHSEGALPASANSRPPRPGQSRTVRRVFRCDDSSRVTGYPRNGHHANVRRVLPGAVSVYAGKTRKRNRASSLLKAPLKTRWSIHQDSGFRSGNGSNRAVQNVRP